MNVQVNNRLLLLARHLRGYTQKEASSLIGLSQGKLSKSEHGLQDFPNENLEALLHAYNLPLSFFTQQPFDLNLGKSYFRRKVSISEKVIYAFKAQITVQQMVIDKLFEPIELPDFDLIPQKVDEKNSPLSIAQNIRLQLGVPHGPIQNITRLLENHGIIIQRLNFGTDKIDALSVISENQRKIIFLNSSMPNDRIRFTLAHELGHIIMHMEFPVNDCDLAEIEADQFAAELLIPRKEIAQELCGLTLQTLFQLKKKWRVSMHAIIRNARDMGIITSDVYRNFQIKFSRAGYSKSEPAPLPIENTTLIDETIKLYKKELGYTISDLCSLACINESDYRCWFESYPFLFLNKGLKWVLPNRD